MANQNYTAAVQLAELADWQINASEKTYLLIKNRLRAYVASMQKAIEQETDRHRQAIEQENKRYEAQLTQLREKLLDGPTRQATKDYESLMQVCRTSQQKARMDASKKNQGAGVTFRTDNIFFRIVGSIIKGRDTDQLAELDHGKGLVAREDHAVAAAMERVSDKARKVRDAKVQMYAREFESAKHQLGTEHQLQKANIENEHNNELATLIGTYRTEFSRYFNSSTFSTAYALVRTTMRQAIGYSCSDKIPARLYLGDRTFVIQNAEGSFSPEIINMFHGVDHRAVSASGNTIRITLPFFRTLEEGYSVFLDVKDAALGSSNKVIWEYVMKVMMNFPVGQTRPLLLDCDSTTELTDFKVIGDSSGRNMVTKPWISEKDIETELKKLETENTNLTISYGTDIASRMQREPIYVVACRNFPKSITPAAMTALSKVISAGSFRGFFGIIQGSAKELALQNGRNANASALDTITKSCLCIKEAGTGYAIGEDAFSFENMDLARQNKTDIFSHLITGVNRYRRQIEKFEYLFSKDAGNVEKMDMHDINTWFRGDASNTMEVPIGISGASTVQKYSIGGVAQHGLISGVTGSGKSTLLKTMIVAAMMKYTPDNLNLYLVDFKEGVEFATFSEYPLPWIKTIALNTQRIFALSILQELQAEFKHRAEVMRKGTVTHIKGAEEKFPRLLLVFDEVQALLSVDDEITKQCIAILSELVSEGRAMNINVIMASQNFSICKGIESLKANMVLRIAMKGSPESAKIVMGEDFSVDQLEQGDSGSAAINTASGARGQTTFFQVGYMGDDEMKKLLSQLAMTWGHLPAKTRIMAIHVNQDRNAKFNRLITDGEVTYNEVPGSYELMLGDEFLVNKKRKIAIEQEPGENLMVIGANEETAKSVFALSMLSVLYGELASRAENFGNELIRLVDMSDEDMPDAMYLDQIASRFPRQIKRVPGRRVVDMIEDTYKVLQDRKRGKADKSERLFLMIFGLDSLSVLRQEMLSEEDGELSLNKKLLQILQYGPELGINTILWARSYAGFKAVVDTMYVNRYFNKRMYFGENADAESVLGIAYDMEDMEEKSVAYRDMDKAVPNAFRVFELPAADWLESVAVAYENFKHKV